VEAACVPAQKLSDRGRGHPPRQQGGPLSLLTGPPPRGARPPSARGASLSRAARLTLRAGRPSRLGTSQPLWTTRRARASTAPCARAPAPSSRARRAPGPRARRSSPLPARAGCGRCSVRRRQARRAWPAGGGVRSQAAPPAQSALARGPAPAGVCAGTGYRCACVARCQEPLRAMGRRLQSRRFERVPRHAASGSLTPRGPGAGRRGDHAPGKAHRHGHAPARRERRGPADPAL